MFESMKLAGTLAGLMKNREALEHAGVRIKHELGALRAVGDSGGGAVRATVSGSMRVTDLRMSSALAAAMATPEGLRDVEQLVTDAVNAAMAEAQRQAQAIVQREAKELGLGDLVASSGLAKLLGG